MMLRISDTSCTRYMNYNDCENVFAYFSIHFYLLIDRYENKLKKRNITTKYIFKYRIYLQYFFFINNFFEEKKNTTSFHLVELNVLKRRRSEAHAGGEIENVKFLKRG